MTFIKMRNLHDFPVFRSAQVSISVWVLILSAFFDASSPAVAPCTKSTAPPDCWKMQTRENRRYLISLKKIGDECTVQRHENLTDIDGRPLVIDPCMDEENRNFMECVLTYNPDINETDSGYNKGTCQCYREWYSDTPAPPIPAYNHSRNFNDDSQEWFTWDGHYKECVVVDKKNCAPIDVALIPYRCGKGNGTDGIEHYGRCIKQGIDPMYKTCSAEAGADIVLLLKYPHLLSMISVGHLLGFGI